MPEVRGNDWGVGLTRRQARTKRAFDLIVGGAGLAVSAPVLGVAIVAARIDTGDTGLFRQQRVGLHGELFDCLKIRTMRPTAEPGTTVTTADDPRITRLGRMLRRTKLDELPQLANVVRGEMSLVGPRPDVPGWADMLTGANRAILQMRPGVTGPASLIFRDEEQLLKEAGDSEAYNASVLWPAKVQVNIQYASSWSLWADVVYLFGTFGLANSAWRKRLEMNTPQLFGQIKK